MSDKKDEINKKNEQDWSKVERTPDLVDYVYDKYGNVPVIDEMLDDLYNFAMMKKKFLSMVESEKVTEKIYRKLLIRYGKASALQVLRRLGSIFTSVYAAKLKRVVSLLEENKFEGDNTPIVIQPPCYSASKDFQDSPDDEEDTRSSQDSKAFMLKNKGLIAEAYEWEEEEVSLDDNEMVEVKVLMALDEENDVVSQESARNGEWVKISMRKVHTLLEIEDNDDRKVCLDYLCIDLNSSKKVNQCISEQIPSQKKKILGVDQLTKDPSTLGQKDLVFVKSSVDDTKVTITGVEIPWLSELKVIFCPNHDMMNHIEVGGGWRAARERRPPLKKLKVIISLEREINPRNPQHAFKRCEACGSSSHTTTDHYDIEWFKRGEALHVKKAEALKSTKAESSNANRSKTPTKRHMTGVKSYLHKYMEQPGPKVVFRDDFTCTTKGYGSIKCNGRVFTKVAFVNGLKYNLINISQLYDAKYIVQFDKKRGTIFNSNKEIVMIAPRVRDVYVLDMTSSTQEMLALCHSL
ncbi:hypothetical protein Tco_1345087 [Tanacetum coccineum]